MRKRTGLVMMTALALGLAMGCASLKGPSDLEQIQNTLAAWESASKAKDVDQVMATISEDFSHEGYDYDAEDKAAMRQFVEAAIAQGNYDGLEIAYKVEDIEIEGDTAEVGPIEWTCTPGTAYIELTLKQEKGGWLIVDASVQEM